MGRSTVHYADNGTNITLRKLNNTFFSVDYQWKNPRTGREETNEMEESRPLQIGFSGDSLARYNPVNALKADIVLKFASNLEGNIVAEHQEIYAAKGMERSSAIYPSINFGTLMMLKRSY